MSPQVKPKRCGCYLARVDHTGWTPGAPVSPDIISENANPIACDPAACRTT